MSVALLEVVANLRPRMAAFAGAESASSISVAIVMGLLALTAIVATVRTRNI